MVTPSAGSVVLVSFPFSDLSASKLRPAVVIASAGRDDWVLCQVTSNPYADANAIEISDVDFASGSLQRVSFVRPGKLFTSNASLMKAEVGHLTDSALTKVLDAVVALLKKTGGEHTTNESSATS
jgi:mRNA interferase MazF